MQDFVVKASAMQSEHVKTLEASLKETREREQKVLEAMQDLRAYNEQLIVHIRKLEARVYELENPKSRRHEDQSWVDKIAVIIGRTGRPMRSRELMRELEALDKDAEMALLADPGKSLSVALSRGVEGGRLKMFKTPGTRGAYYALSKWVDKNGNLSKAMRDEMW